MTKNLLVIVFLFIVSENIKAQCVSDRYLNEVFSSARTFENVVYNRPLHLQGACLIESNIDTVNFALDIYEPSGDTLQKRPVIVYAHGGAFLLGDRRMVPIEDFCRKMANRGYVVVSIDYRKCFNVASTEAAVRAVYRAVQDMKAAIRYVKSNAAILRADTTRIIAGGNSAGSIMAIHAAYAKEPDRPLLQATYANPDLGCLECSGNTLQHIGTPNAVINLWGAIVDTLLIDAGDVPMIAIHGAADGLVYPTYDTPFSYPAFPKLFGSVPIIQHMNRLGIENEFHYLIGEGHEPWLLNAPLVDTFSNWITNFMYRALLRPAKPQVTFSQNICERDTVTFSVNNASATSRFCWNIQGGNIVETNANESVIKVYFDNATSAFVEVKERNNIDAISETRHLNFQVKVKPFANAGADRTICIGDTINLNGTGGTTFTWLTIDWLANYNTRNPIAYPQSTTNYIFKATQSTCSDFDTITVVVNLLPSIVSKGNVNICEGDTAQLEVIANGNIEWQPSDFLDDATIATPLSFPSTTIEYKVVVTDSNNCVNEDKSKVIVNSFPPIPQINNFENILSTISGYQYQWYRNDTLIANSNINILTPQQSGYYSVKISNNAGCSSYSENVFFEMPLSVFDSENDVVTIYPNPSNGVFTVQLSAKENFTASIFDMQAKKIMEQHFFADEATFYLQNIPKGVYQLQLKQSHKFYTHKLVLY
jgi:dienelactone hydrolase